jgi:hypothetical protein
MATFCIAFCESYLRARVSDTKVATVLSSVPASSDTVEYEYRQDEAVLNKVLEK